MVNLVGDFGEVVDFSDSRLLLVRGKVWPSWTGRYVGDLVRLDAMDSAELRAVCTEGDGQGCRGPSLL